jgi:hypothetical protein
MSDMGNWDHKDEWHRRGDGFTIVVKRHTTGMSSIEPRKGPHRWAVYAYIYPSHRLFRDFIGDDISQPAACDLPLHEGPSYLHWHYDANCNATSVQIGADYDHLCDGHYSHFATAEESQQVFNDADSLWRHLEAANNRSAVI